MSNVPFLDYFVSSYFACYVLNSGYTMPEEHIHYHHEFIFNFSAIPVRNTLNGHAQDTDTPFIVYRAPYMLHSTSTLCSQEYKRYIVNIHPCVLTEFGQICDMGHLHGQNMCLIPTTEEQMARLEPLLQRLTQLSANSNTPKHAWVSMLASMLYEINCIMPPELTASLPVPSYIQEVLHYVVMHVGDNLTIDTLSAIFFCSRNKLTRDFLAVTRMTIHEYIVAIRVSCAKAWLAEDAPIMIVAERCGFQHESSFIRMFHAAVGITPREYRKLTKQRKRITTLATEATDNLIQVDQEEV